jgi:signal transduction histidine kinase
MLKGWLNRAHFRVEFLHSGSTELVYFPGEMRQVLANIITNAIDAMPGGGTLILKLRSARTAFRLNRVLLLMPDPRHRVFFHVTKTP